MSGDGPIVIEAPADSVVARAVEALGRFPTEPTWVLVGGIAVFLQLGAVTRPTADADTIARSQAALVERLVADEVATVVSGGDLQVPIRDSILDIDVMDLADDPLPGDDERRAFALARRHSLATATHERIVVTHHDAPIAEAVVPIASPGALVALKTVSMVRRPHSSSPHKVGSDIHDLVRLVTAVGARTIATDIAQDVELATWVADQVDRAFGTDSRYTLLRLRRNDQSTSAQALTDAEVQATIVLADELGEHLTGGDG